MQLSDRRMPALFTVIALMLWGLPNSASAGDTTTLDEWLEQQVLIESWAADVQQTRKLRALVKPLVATGHVVFVKPKKFRWQLGDPPRTLAIGTATELTVAYPRLRQIQRYRYSGDIDPALRQVLDLLEIGFPTSVAAFHERYELVESQLAGTSRRFELQPRGKDARRLLEKATIIVSTEDLRLLATEFEFPDGSLMQNEFSNAVKNEPVDERLFDLAVDDDWEVVDSTQNDNAR